MRRMVDPTQPGAEVFPEDGAEAREQLRVALHESAVALKRDREALLGELDVSEDALAARVAALGFDGDAARIFDLLPLVHVAWADGAIQPGERASILGLLVVRGIPMGKAYTTMVALLEKEPSAEYLDESLGLLRTLIERGGAAKAETIVGLCIMVAEAAGGFLGLLSPISRVEKQAIERIAERLGEAAVEEFKRRLG
jgi:tellurite resistance protein